MKFTPTIAFLVISNLIPLAGVFLFGWSVASILVLYWLESVIIGGLNIIKIFACQGHVIGKLFISVFFSFHFGMFCYGHAVFISEMFDAREIFESVKNGGPLLWAALSFLASHFFSLLINFFGKKEYLGREANVQMFMPYGRVVVMHLVILIGGLFVQLFNQPVIALIFLIGLKIFIDIGAHKISHKDGGVTA